jgi:hypothetical protein
MRLVSDFSDCYDHHFSLEGPEFRRVSTEGPDKRGQFALLVRAGFLTPPHGLLRDVVHTWWESEKKWVTRVVAYEDESAHRGDGKRWMSEMHYRRDGCVSRLEENERVHNLFCSAYVGGPAPAPGVSWRLLQLGRHRVWLEYWSEADWRSNVGDGGCRVIGYDGLVGYHDELSLLTPLWAVDFALGNEAYAIDFNVCPGVGGSGAERVVPPKAIHEEILLWEDWRSARVR